MTIIIVEDNPVFSKGLQQIIELIPGAELSQCYADAETAISEMPAFEPDIAIVDIQLRGKLTGLDVIRQIKPLLPATEFLVCTVNDNSNIVFDALSLGASGYILKDSTVNEIASAIADISTGGAPMSPFIAKKVITSFRENKQPENVLLSALTTREREVLDLLAKGLLYKEIAGSLCIAHPTVKKHIRNIYEKLHVQNKVEALNKLR